MDKTQRQKILDEFGKAFIAIARDGACGQLQRMISGHLNGYETDGLLYEKILQFGPEQIQTMCQLITESVDVGISSVLYFIEQKDIRLLYEASDEETVDITHLSDGLQGELWTEDGWVARFSKFKDGVQPMPQNENPTA